ncbi:ArsR/SmtB family transcription factor [Glutamicibacter endophyticus]|uniref:ArsR/SmtB family transcription factor n=1 Tax=Glutamicibacter endophyticus TaxID=1522174 RepID=UPI003AF03F7E
MKKLARTYIEQEIPQGVPEPLPQPESNELRLEKVLAALSDPLRLRIMQRLLTSSDDFDHSCSWFGFDRPKSSLTHHFKALREAGLINQRQYGLERRSRVRTVDLNDRFPGLIELILDWQDPEESQ